MTSPTSARRRSAASAQAKQTSEKPWMPPDKQLRDLKLWVRLLACAHTAEQRVKGKIKDQFGINQTQFNLLSQLDRMPQGIRMGEVARRTVVTGSNVTVVVDDLEQRGLVTRAPADDDRRATVIKLTPKGRKLFAEMAPIHANWISDLFVELPADNKDTLITQLDSLKAAMRATLSTSL